MDSLIFYPLGKTKTGESWVLWICGAKQQLKIFEEAALSSRDADIIFPPYCSLNMDPAMNTFQSGRAFSKKSQDSRYYLKLL